MLESAKISWQDISDSESSDYEQVSQPPLDLTPTEPLTPSIDPELQKMLDDQSVPYMIKMFSLPFSEKTQKQIFRFLCLTLDEEKQVNLDLRMQGDRYLGEVWITTANKNIAQKLLKKHNQVFKGRQVQIRSNNQSDRGYRSGRELRRSFRDSRRVGRYREQQRERYCENSQIIQKDKLHSKTSPINTQEKESSENQEEQTLDWNDETQVKIQLAPGRNEVQKAEEPLKQPQKSKTPAWASYEDAMKVIAKREVLPQEISEPVKKEFPYRPRYFRIRNRGRKY